MGALARFVRRLRYGRPIVVVSGLPRSGTSMMMQMLQAGGLEILTDAVRTPDGSNPKGYFEFEAVKDLDKGPPPAWLTGARGKAVKIVSSLVRWLPESHDYQVIFMRRNLDEVILSQNKMLADRGSRQTRSERAASSSCTRRTWRTRCGSCAGAARSPCSWSTTARHLRSPRTPHAASIDFWGAGSMSIGWLRPPIPNCIETAAGRGESVKRWFTAALAMGGCLIAVFAYRSRGSRRRVERTAGDGAARRRADARAFASGGSSIQRTPTWS